MKKENWYSQDVSSLGGKKVGGGPGFSVSLVTFHLIFNSKSLRPAYNTNSHVPTNMSTYSWGGEQWLIVFLFIF